MKILFVISSLKNGGAERVVVNLANSLSNRRHNVSVAVFDKGDSDYMVSDKVSIIPCNIRNKSKVHTFFYSVNKIRTTIKDINPDVVVSFLSTVNIYSILGNLKIRKPIIVSERNDPNLDPQKWYYRVLRKLTYQLADGFVFQTKDAKLYFNNTIQKRSTIIQNPLFVDEKYIKNNYNREINSIVSVGRLEKQKNFIMLIDAFSEIISVNDKCRLTIYGEGSMRAEIEQYISEKELVGKVLLPGRRENIHEKLVESDLFVLPSNYEGMSNALMEAMGIGLPCISTDCPIGGSAELIKNYENGILIPVGSKMDLIDAINLLSSNPKLSSKIGENAKRLRETNTLDQISSLWEQYLIKTVSVGTKSK